MAPSVTLVTGSAANDGVMTISGSGFGTKSRSKPWLWADFQTNHDPHATLSFNTAWAQVQNRSRTTSVSRWGTGSSVSTWDYTSSSTTGRPTTLRIPTMTTTYGTKLLFSYWVRSDINYLTHTGNTSQNWKLGMRIWKGPGATNYPNVTLASVSQGETASQLRMTMEDWTVATGTDRSFIGSSWGFPTTTWRLETWFIKLNASVSATNGTLIARKNGTTVKTESAWRWNHTSRPDHITTPYIQHVIANANVPSGTNCWYSDCYADDSWNHVVLGNASTYSACTQFEFQPYTGWSNTSVTVATRNGTLSGTKYLYVVDGDNAANSSGYDISSLAPTAPPTILSVSPSSGPEGGGTVLTITGTDYVATPAVKVGGTDATAEHFSSSTQIEATTPAGTAGTKDVLLTNPDTSNVTAAGAFTYIAAPTYTSITPAVGVTTGGTDVVIVGTGFVSGATVTVGGASATNVVLTGSTIINCTTPAGTAGARDVVITNPDTQAATGTGEFTYEAPVASHPTRLKRCLLGLG